MTDRAPACFAPIELRGRVHDLVTKAGVAGARVVAVDSNGAALTGVTTTGADGAYRLAVPTERAADGTPSSLAVSLRADAAAFQTFPGGLRRALPIDVATAVREGDGAWVVSSALTEVGLVPLANAPAGSVTGKVEPPPDHAGVLVVAESSTGKGTPAIADRDGDYAIYNLADGAYTIKAYAKGHVYGSSQLTIAGQRATADLRLSAEQPGSISGNIGLVNAPGGSVTSVVVFVESTFDPVTEHGIGPPAIRAPESGPPTISGAFTIAGLPPGKYVVLAGYENDRLVRDPDQCQSGTAIVHVTVAPGQQVALSESFKITEALAIMGPGADAAEAVTSAPMLRFANDSSASSYDVEVFDALGAKVWNTTVADSQGPLSIAYGGPLTPGMYYQFRATSYRLRGGGAMRCAISRTEQLRGVFFRL